jgi:hypothetical protein
MLPIIATLASFEHLERIIALLGYALQYARALVREQRVSQTPEAPGSGQHEY